MDFTISGVLFSLFLFLFISSLIQLSTRDIVEKWKTNDLTKKCRSKRNRDTSNNGLDRELLLVMEVCVELLDQRGDRIKEIFKYNWTKRKYA